MFKTARFKVHNPSRHKQSMLRYALFQYHLTLKKVLEAALSLDDLESRIIVERKGRKRLDVAALSRLLYTLAPKNWALAPLRDYLVGDAKAMLSSHFEKLLKGKNESNPPTLGGLDRPEEAAYLAAADNLALIPSLAAEETEEIERARLGGQPRRAKKLSNLYSSRAERESVRNLLRSLETPVPRPIEFTRPEFARGFLLARKGSNLYILVRLFNKSSSYWKQAILDEGFIDCRTGELIAGRKYPGLILPLELGREYHEEEYLRYGRPQSAKLLVKRSELREEEFFLHVAFEFTPEAVITNAVLGIDRGFAKIGTASVVDANGVALIRGLELEGTAFHRELTSFEQRIAEAQRRGIRHSRLFRLRRRWETIVLGEYANHLVKVALDHKALIALEKIDARSMVRFLRRSQFRKLHDLISYKAERAGLPKPIEVPAAFTSQTCAHCGYRDSKNRPKQDAAGRAIQNMFLCISCGNRANADENASEIIALRALHQLQNGGKFQKFSIFQQWLIENRRQVGLAADTSS
ncbi:MAG TPA: transposase [Bryobacteraceae bacterium]|nr:transposase [Bryobacteraceae bacterium]